MVVDTSAILAIIFEEAEFAAVVTAIDSATVVRVSVASYFEAAMVPDRRGDALQRSALDDLMEESVAHLEPVTYALAKSTREPLLFKGNDFSKTDLPPAVKPLQ